MRGPNVRVIAHLQVKLQDVKYMQLKGYNHKFLYDSTMPHIEIQYYKISYSGVEGQWQQFYLLKLTTYTYLSTYVATAST